MSPGARPRPWMHATEHLVGDVSSYIDESILNAFLAGIVLALATAWGVVFFNRLWQSSLRHDAAEAIAAAGRRGLELQPSGVRARVAAVGSVGSERVEIIWAGGWRGARTLVRRGARRSAQPLVRTADELEALLAPSDGARPQPSA